MNGATFLRELVEQHGIGSLVQWLGPLSREEKIRWLRSCEVYVQPSHYEGFGLAMAEAMGSGACVITCDVGAVRDVVADCGIYVSPGSPAALAGAIRQALTDETTLHSLQQRAVDRARQEFAFDSKLKRLQGYLRQVGIY